VKNDPFSLPTAAELRDGLRGDITKLREQLEQVAMERGTYMRDAEVWREAHGQRVKENEELRAALDAAWAERDKYRESWSVTTADNNATFDAINKAIDAAGITFGEDDTYAACINRLAAERDAARQALNDTDIELAKAMSRAEVLDEEVKAFRLRYIEKCYSDAGSVAHTIWYTKLAKELEAAMEATDRTHALDPAKFVPKEQP
jgi:predicted  nucleic acid-binding Zn-ribbon protein